MGNRLNRYYEKQIISEKSLSAVEFLISFLKQNVRNRDLFHTVGHDVRVQQIVNELDRGNISGLPRLLEHGWVVESASALQYFLIKLRKPLIPHHIQALALDENPGVSAEVIAQDILGLLRQDVAGRHEQLLVSILDLLNNILKHSPTDELRGCNIPITMLPIFFNMQSHHIPQWRRVAMVFMEIIRLAPRYYSIQTESEMNMDIVQNNERIEILKYNEFELPGGGFGGNPALLQQRLLGLNLVLRQHLIRAGYSGDCQDVEIYQHNQQFNLEYV